MKTNWNQLQTAALRARLEKMKTNWNQLQTAFAGSSREMKTNWNQLQTAALRARGLISLG